MIELKNLHFQYEGGNVALRGVDLEIPQGQFIAVLGHNGSGKSTLALHLNALLLPTTGDVIVNGLNSKSPEDFWPLRRQVGMVFQNPDNQLIATSVEEDTAFGPENLGIEPTLIRTRVDEALSTVGMEGYKDKSVHLLSGGQKQRVAIAGVMAMRPKVLVLDEPTAMLDPRGRKEVMSAVKKLNNEDGITVVYITHMMEEAAQAQRIAVMEDGKIAMDGTPEEVFYRINELRELRLDVPLAVEMTSKLRSKGITLPGTILTINALAEAIAAL